jgi:hypothetical protein
MNTADLKNLYINTFKGYNNLQILSNKYQVPLVFETGDFGELLTCILYDTNGYGKNQGWDNQLKHEVKTAQESTISKSNTRWTISKATHLRYSDELTKYIFVYIRLDAFNIHTVVGELPSNDPNLQRLIENAGNTLNLTCHGNSVNDLPIKVVHENMYEITCQELELIQENLNDTQYFGTNTGRSLKAGKKRGLTSRP